METNQPANQPNSSSYILAIHPHRVFISYCKMYKYHLSHIPTYHFLSSATEIPPSKSFLKICIWPEIQEKFAHPQQHTQGAV